MTFTFARYYIKSLLTSRVVIAFGLGWTVFWMFMGAFFFPTNLLANATTLSGVLQYTSINFALNSLLALGALSIRITFAIFFATGAMVYVHKFGNLDRTKYLSYSIAGSILVGILFALVMTAASYGIYSYKFEMNILPVNIIAMLAVTALSSVFLYLLSLLIDLGLINYLGMKNVNFVMFIPLTLSFIFGYAPIYGQFGTLQSPLLYGSPFTEIISLQYYSYSGMDMPAHIFNSAGGTGGLNLGTVATGAMVLGLVSWIIVLVLVNLVLLQRVRLVDVEDMRPL